MDTKLFIGACQLTHSYRDQKHVQPVFQMGKGVLVIVQLD